MIDPMLLTPAQLERFIHMQSIVARQQEAAAKVLALRAYYDGDHPVLLTDRQQEFLGNFLVDTRNQEGNPSGSVTYRFPFSHNTVKSVVDTLRERLNVTGFSVNGKAIDDPKADMTGPEAKLAALFWAWWEENRYDAQQIRLHRRAIRDGLSYVMVDYDSEPRRPRFTLHPVYDGTSGIVYHRSPENPDVVLFANKYFWSFNPLEPGKTGDERKTVYLPGEIRKYKRGKGEYGWEAISDPGDPSWPLPWLDRRGEPLGIPIIEFENPGGSEVVQIIGLQNALNKGWLDLIAAADSAGFPILAIEDADPESYADAVAASEEDDDIEGDDELFMAPGRILDLHGAKAHRIESGDLSQLINVIELTVTTIAGVSHTPQYYLRPVGGSDVPSGEALKMLESGLVKRAEERQLIFGQAWADVMMMAHKLERTFGDASIPDLPKLKVKTTWASAEVRNEKSDAEMGEIYKRLGIPDEEIWLKLGFSPQQCAKFKAMLRSDQASQTAAAVTAIQGAMARQQAALPGQAAQPVANRQNGNGNGVAT